MVIYVLASHKVTRDIRKYIPGRRVRDFRQVGMLPVSSCALWQLKPYPNILAATRTLHLQVASKLAIPLNMVKNAKLDVLIPRAPYES